MLGVACLCLAKDNASVTPPASRSGSCCAEPAAEPCTRRRKARRLTLGTAAYHSRMLAQRGLIEVSDETQGRGATEHIYELTP